MVAGERDGHKTTCLRPSRAKPFNASPVCMPIHADGPTCDCHTSRNGFECPRRSITALTDADTSRTYGSPRFTTDIGRECAEKRSTTSDLFSAGNFASARSMFCATACDRAGKREDHAVSAARRMFYAA